MGEKRSYEEMTMATGHQRSRAAGFLHPKMLLTAFLAGVALLAAVAVWPTDSAIGAEGFIKASVTPSNTQAGGHPDVHFVYEWLTRRDDPKDPCECEDARMIVTHTPTGFTGSPHVLPKCDLTEFSFGDCPEEAQVGLFSIGEAAELSAPVYNMVTNPDQAGLIAFKVPILDVPVFLDIAARTESDYGLDTTAGPIYHPLPVFNVEFTLWGVPADPKNDALRYKTPLPTGCLICGEKGATSNAPLRPYLQNPTTCGVPLQASVDLEYYTGRSIHADIPYPATTGCDTLSFNPSLTAQPTTRMADTASGVDINMKIPQTQSPTTPSPSQLRATRITFPPGFTINPNAANGKLACSDLDSAIGLRRGAASCPEFSKIGTISIDSPSLPGPIAGAAYIGEAKTGDRYRVILAADGFGTHVKVAGSIRPDLETGQVVAVFEDLPQSSLSEFDLHIFGSERGTLATPTHCGTYPIRTEFVPWNSNLANQSSLSYFTIDSGPNGERCPDARRPFTPRLFAGNANTTAGMHSPFTLRVSRDDGNQTVVGLDVETPPGFGATLRGIPYCTQEAIDRLARSTYSGVAEQVASACPAASQIGTATTGAGAGSRPLYVDGKVYLAGPYKGAPLSLLVVIPAVSGPYDLGNVAVRAAVHVDPTTAEVTAIADPIPQIIEGIPLRIRLIQVSLDRPNFTLNPTNCDPFSINAVLLGDQGTRLTVGAPFQVANCAELPYGPKLRFRLNGGLKRRGHPALRAFFSAASGEANTRRVSVTLPKGLLLDNAHIKTVCTRAEFDEGACPEDSRIGRAVVTTPLLDDPLDGSVYLRTSSNRLPDLVLDLKGQIDIEIAARVDSVRGRLRATFASVPDAPVDSVTLNLIGGSKGLLINSQNLCGATKAATVQMTGQNGVRARGRSKLETSCGSNKNAKRHPQMHQAKVVR